MLVVPILKFSERQTIVRVLVNVRILRVRRNSIAPGIAWPDSPDPGLFMWWYVDWIVTFMPSTVSTDDVGCHYWVFDAWWLDRKVDIWQRRWCIVATRGLRLLCRNDWSLTYDADLTLIVTPWRKVNSVQSTQESERLTIVLSWWIHDEHQCSIHLVSNADCTPSSTFRSRNLKEKICRGGILSGR